MTRDYAVTQTDETYKDPHKVREFVRGKLRYVRSVWITRTGMVSERAFDFSNCDFKLSEGGFGTWCDTLSRGHFRMLKENRSLVRIVSCLPQQGFECILLLYV